MINEDDLRQSLKLYLVTDSDILKERDFYDCIEKAILGGVTTVQLREKDASGKEFLEKAIKLREITKKHNVNFIINDRVDIAIISEADGVHVGQSDIDAKYVRKLIGKDKILGVSVSNIEEAYKAKEDGADYIGVGAMFSTSTKVDAKIVSIDEAKLIKKVGLPMVLIGGVNLNTLDKLSEINSDGYAIVSAILNSDDIYKESRIWRNKLNKNY